MFEHVFIITAEIRPTQRLDFYEWYHHVHRREMRSLLPSARLRRYTAAEGEGAHLIEFTVIYVLEDPGPAPGPIKQLVEERWREAGWRVTFGGTHNLLEEHERHAESLSGGMHRSAHTGDAHPRHLWGPRRKKPGRTSPSAQPLATALAASFPQRLPMSSDEFVPGLWNGPELEATEIEASHRGGSIRFSWPGVGESGEVLICAQVPGETPDEAVYRANRTSRDTGLPVRVRYWVGHALCHRWCWTEDDGLAQSAPQPRTGRTDWNKFFRAPLL